MQKALNEELFQAAYKGRLEDVLLFLERGAEIDGRNSTGSTPLMGAAEQGHFEVVRVLLEEGADITLRNEYNNTAGYYAKSDNIREILKNPPPKRVGSADEVIFERKVSNRTLEEVFNFVSLERISLIRNGKRGPVEAVVRESFSAVTDESALRKAFEEHVRRGGTADESAVFPNKLLKNKLPR